jgi:ABC-type transport system involved in multi-copper enzyme maturation permease subunit
MRALIEKELRLLLPAFLAALVLAIVPVWILPLDSRNPGMAGGWRFMFGAIMLALSSFGREVGFKTIPFILAQPFERSRIWWTKIAVLGICTALTYDAWWLSNNLSSMLRPAGPIPPEVLAFVALMGAVFTAGGLWMTLLLRQVVAAFCLALLVPWVLIFGIQAMGAKVWMICAALGVYAAAAFFLARWRFLHLQDTAWTGGVISFGRRRAVAGASVIRDRGPWRELFLKELKLHEFTLAAIAGLFVLHLGAMALRKAGAGVFSASTLTMLDMFGAVWVFVPLVAGTQSVAEERQLGVLDGLLCLPVSRRTQYWVKLAFVLVLGGMLCPTLLCAAEGIGSAFGFKAQLIHGQGLQAVFYIFLAFSLFGFYASTLTRSGVQAIAVGVVVITVSIYVFHVLNLRVAIETFGLRFWPVIAGPVLAAAIIWLGYGNFEWTFESARRWRRNILGLIATIILISGSAAAVFHRVWEFAMPLEEAHGPARLSAGKAAVLNNYGENYGEDGLSAVLPDGRLWMDRLVYGLRPTVSGGYFAPGSNWVDAVLLAEESVAIRSDGTLWVSDKPGWRDRLVQYGAHTDWQRVERYSDLSVVLLRRDGTLWSWGAEANTASSALLVIRDLKIWRMKYYSPGGSGTNSLNDVIALESYPGLRSFFRPRRIGPDSDWERIVRGWQCIYAWKRDGSAWAVHWSETNSVWDSVRQQGLDNIQFRSFNRLGLEVGVRDDGTLWWHRPWRLRKPPETKTGMSELVQIGKDSDWEAVSGGGQLLALKRDGSIWKWKPFHGGHGILGPLQEAPERLGSHDDWVGIGSWFNGSVALAADGTLWRWPATDAPPGWDNDFDGWLGPSRRPAKIENILDARE